MSWPLRSMFLSLCLAGVGCGASGHSTATSPELVANPAQGREAWVDALAGGDSAQIWALLGPAARARFKDGKQFDTWCKRRCADLLVLAVGVEGHLPEVEVLFARGLRVQKAADGWAVYDPLLSETADQALQRLVLALSPVLASRPLSALQAVASLGANACQEVGPDQAICRGANGVVVHLNKQAGAWRLGGWISPE